MKTSGRCSPTKSARAKSGTWEFRSSAKAAKRRRGKRGAWASKPCRYSTTASIACQLYFPHAAQHNLGILARVPLASGLLSGKYRAGVTFPANDWRSTFEADKMRKDLAEVERIHQTEVPPGVPMAQWALAWCLRNPLVSAVIPGCQDPAQVASNAAAAELEIGA